MTLPITSDQVANNPEEEEKARLERLDRSADEMAGKASKEEQHFDRDHDIFRK